MSFKPSPYVYVGDFVHLHMRMVLKKNILYVIENKGKDKAYMRLFLSFFLFTEFAGKVKSSTVRALR